MVQAMENTELLAMEPEPIARGQRIQLRPLSPCHSDQLLAYYQNNREFHQPWSPLRHERFFTIAGVHDEIEHKLRERTDGRSHSWVIFANYREELLGRINVSSMVMGPFCSCFIGYDLDYNAQGHGYMTEAMALAIEILFGRLGLHRIEANVMPGNKPSLAVLERLGFYNEGLAYKYLKINGVWEDHIHMVLRNEPME